MRRLLMLAAAWTVSVLSPAMVVGACNEAGREAATPADNGAAASRHGPELKEITIPRGTTLALALDDSVASATSRVDERQRARCVAAVCSVAGKAR